jgi:hypothetical protein
MGRPEDAGNALSPSTIATLTEQEVAEAVYAFGLSMPLLSEARVGKA